MSLNISSCLNCGAALTRSFVDLGSQPLANSFVPLERANEPDKIYPLHARVCDVCLLVQVDRLVPPEDIFGEYAYFSSYSQSWLDHAEAYVKMAVRRFNLNTSSMVVEIASNDGYLLQYVVKEDIPCLGIEPAVNVADMARAKGIPTETVFFGEQTASRLRGEGKSADLIASKNVLAHVPDINDFVKGVSILLKPEGVYTVEFPHLLNLIHYGQFDTIYHEHFSYLSVVVIERILSRHGLRIFDIEEIPTHGGSLRVFICHESAGHIQSAGYEVVRAKELDAGLGSVHGYSGFDVRVKSIRTGLLQFLEDAAAHGKRIAAYGAAAKGNTLLNYCAVTPRQIAFVVDKNPIKQNTLLPGTRIPVRDPDALLEMRPDYVLILPWNLRDEITAQLPQVHAWGGRFVTAIPELFVW
jgi:ubiquinone/menaquinone biosynthesis C-methylase UbiE